LQTIGLSITGTGDGESGTGGDRVNVLPFARRATGPKATVPDAVVVHVRQQARMAKGA